MRCETKEELIAMVAREGVEVTPEEAEAYMAEMADLELDEELLMNVAGGGCYDKGHNSDRVTRII